MVPVSYNPPQPDDEIPGFEIEEDKSIENSRSHKSSDSQHYENEGEDSDDIDEVAEEEKFIEDNKHLMDEGADDLFGKPFPI